MKKAAGGVANIDHHGRIACHGQGHDRIAQFQRHVFVKMRQDQGCFFGL